MSDRTLGYILLTSLALLILIFGSYFVWVNYFPVDRRMIVFPQIGNLKIEDPVSEHGMNIGRVESITWTPRAVYVSIVTGKKMTIYSDYHISIDDKGLMGERVVSVRVGTPGSEIVPPSDTLKGTFKFGVSEAVGMVWVLRDHVTMLRNVVSTFRFGDGKKAGFPPQFNAFMHDLDSMTAWLEQLTLVLGDDVAAAMDTVKGYISVADSLSNALDSLAPRYKRDIVKFTADAESLVTTLQSVVDTVTVMLAPLEDPQSILWRDDMQKMKGKMGDVRKAVRDLQRHGLDLPVLIVH